MKETGTRVIALGFFDGVHIGHGALLRRTRERATELGLRAAAMSFDSHPDTLVSGVPVPLINSMDDRAALMRRLYGIDDVIFAHFDRAMMEMPWEDFLGDFLVRQHGAAHLVCGHDFRFGYRGQGTPERLRQLCAPLGVEVIVLPMAQFEEKPVSSTRIRTALEGGDIPAANAMLGMPYAIRFTVHHGAGLGRTLGVPTINQIYPQGFQLPRYGIYITRTKIGEHWYPSATGLGTRPTVNSDESKVTCETFIPGFTGDLYGTDPVVEFHAYLSPSKKFDTLDELRGCIDHAAKRAQEYFAE